MTKRLKGISACTLALLAAILGCMPAPALAQTDGATAGGGAQWQTELAAWRTQREQELAAPDGWLTLVGLEWLKRHLLTQPDELDFDDACL